MLAQPSVHLSRSIFRQRLVRPSAGAVVSPHFVRPAFALRTEQSRQFRTAAWWSTADRTSGPSTQPPSPSSSPSPPKPGPTVEKDPASSPSAPTWSNKLLALFQRLPGAALTRSSPTTSPGHGQATDEPSRPKLDFSSPKVEVLLNRLKSEWSKNIDIEQLKQNPKLWISLAAKSLNQITGYQHIELLKRSVFSKETEFVAARQALEVAKRDHETAIQERATGQREINSLLQRKHLWADTDVNRFTELYRSEHANEQAEIRAKRTYESQEKAVDQKYAELVDAIRIRYHDEQLWSDKIRAAATYGTWAVLALNMFIFVFVHILIEPRKRKKILDHVDQAVQTSSSDLRTEWQTHTPQWWSDTDSRLQRLEATLNRHIDDNTQLVTRMASVAPPVLATTIETAASLPVDNSGETLSLEMASPEDTKQPLPAVPSSNQPTYTRNEVIRYTCESALLSCIVTLLVSVWLGQ
ncbi:sensitivity to high expression protein she9 [Dimargaris cristalligena]|nr:sensitivity to high expression protein she9 [Dimargaris cristalligena]